MKQALAILLLAATTCFGQGYGTYLRTVMAHTNGAIYSPTNLFLLNADLISAITATNAAFSNAVLALATGSTNQTVTGTNDAFAGNVSAESFIASWGGQFYGDGSGITNAPSADALLLIDTNAFAETLRDYAENRTNSPVLVKTNTASTLYENLTLIAKLIGTNEAVAGQVLMSDGNQIYWADFIATSSGSITNVYLVGVTNLTTVWGGAYSNVTAFDITGDMVVGGVSVTNFLVTGTAETGYLGVDGVMSSKTNRTAELEVTNAITLGTRITAWTDITTGLATSASVVAATNDLASALTNQVSTTNLYILGAAGSAAVTIDGTLSVSNVLTAGSNVVGWAFTDRSNVKWWGAVGDGVTDDTWAIQQALNNLTNIIIPSGSYLITNTLTATQSVSIEAHGATLYPTGAFTAFTANSTETGTGYVSAIVQVNREYVSVTNAETLGVTTNHIVALTSSNLWYYDNRGSLVKGELHKVDRVSGTNIYLTESTADAYNCPTEIVEVTWWTPVTVRIEGLTVTYPQNAAATAISIAKGYQVFLDAVTINNASVTGISLSRCMASRITGCTVTEANSPGLGYGIQVNGSLDTIIEECAISGSRRGVDFSGTFPSRFGLVTHCDVTGIGLFSDGSSIYDDSSGYGTHGTAEHIKFANNTVKTCEVGFVLRGGNIVVQNNLASGKMAYFAYITSGAGHTIKGNSYNYGLDSRTMIGSTSQLWSTLDYFIGSITTNTTGHLRVFDNDVRGVRVAFARLGSYLTPAVSYVEMANNCIWYRPVSGTVQFIEAVTNTVLSHSVLGPNNEVTVTGTYTNYHSGTITLDSTSMELSTAYNVFAFNHPLSVNTNALSAVASLHVNGDVLVEGGATFNASSTNASGVSVVATSNTWTLGTANVRALTASNIIARPLTYDAVPLQVFNNAGAISLVVNSNGNGGLGTANPGSKLHVQSGSSGYTSTAAGLQMEHTSSQYVKMFASANTQQGISMSGGTATAEAGLLWEDGSRGDYLQLYAPSTLLILKGGNVGFNTNAPATTLDISGTIGTSTGPGGTHYTGQTSNYWAGDFVNGLMIAPKGPDIVAGWSGAFYGDASGLTNLPAGVTSADVTNKITDNALLLTDTNTFAGTLRDYADNQRIAATNNVKIARTDFDNYLSGSNYLAGATVFAMQGWVTNKLTSTNEFELGKELTHYAEGTVSISNCTGVVNSQLRIGSLLLIADGTSRAVRVPDHVFTTDGLRTWTLTNATRARLTMEAWGNQYTNATYTPLY